MRSWATEGAASHCRGPQELLSSERGQRSRGTGRIAGGTITLSARSSEGGVSVDTELEHVDGPRYRPENPHWPSPPTPAYGSSGVAFARAIALAIQVESLSATTARHALAQK